MHLEYDLLLSRSLQRRNAERGPYAPRRAWAERIICFSAATQKNHLKWPLKAAGKSRDARKFPRWHFHMSTNISMLLHLCVHISIWYHPSAAFYNRTQQQISNLKGPRKHSFNIWRNHKKSHIFMKPENLQYDATWDPEKKKSTSHHVMITFARKRRKMI